MNLRRGKRGDLAPENVGRDSPRTKRANRQDAFAVALDPVRPENLERVRILRVDDPLDRRLPRIANRLFLLRDLFLFVRPAQQSTSLPRHHLTQAVAPRQSIAVVRLHSDPVGCMFRTGLAPSGESRL